MFEIIPALGVLSVAVSGFEADDIIATLSTRFKADMDEIVIVTQDKDILQLVDEKVRVSSPKKGAAEKVVYTREAVKERFGVYPETLADFLVIVGDASDNLPGIKGVGPKAAIELINRFGNLDSILENIERIGNPRLVTAIALAKNCLKGSNLLDIFRNL
ncbi:MAG: 5'-3' exonuclease H3TH domain-containing protein [bacterium]